MPALHTNTEKTGVPALAIENVSKQYGTLRWRGLGGKPGKQALTEVSFTVERGETVGLLGPNGAGKTSLLKVITSLIQPSSGRVLVCGFDLNHQPAKARRQMGMVTCDERSFYWRLTAWQNLSFFGTLQGLTRVEIRERGGELLEALGLLEAADRPYQSYSSGMKQKLAIARGLLGDPSIVFYDEPTRSLDPLSAQNIRAWIIEKRKRSPGQTHVIATNQLSEAEQLCNRVVILSRGRLVAQGTVAEVRERYAPQDYETHRITYAGAPLPSGLLSGAAGLIGVTEEEAGVLCLCVEPGSHALSMALGLILGADRIVLRCEAVRVSFDEVFCGLVAGQPAAAVAMEAHA